MKKLKNGHQFVNINHTEKFQITNPHKCLGLCRLPSVNGNEILAFCKYQSYRKISNYQPFQILGLWFSECQQKQNISVSHYEKIEKWLTIS